MHVVYSFKLGHTIPLCARTTGNASIALLRWQADFWLLTLYYYTCPREWAQEFPGGGHPEVQSLITAAPGSCSPGEWHAVILPLASSHYLFWLYPQWFFAIFSYFSCGWRSLLHKDWPIQFPLLCLNCSYSLAIFLLNCFAVFLVGNFNIRNLGPSCKCTLLMSPPRLILSLCLWGSCHLENFNFILSNFFSFWYNVYVLSLILSQKLSLCWCHKDSLSCFLAVVFWFCFSH